MPHTHTCTQIEPPVTFIPTTSSITTSSTTDSERQREPSVFGNLQPWEGGLILANIGVLLILIAAVVIVTVYFVTRRKRRQRRSGGEGGYSEISLTKRKNSPTKNGYVKARSPSMLEQIHVETEAVDFEGKTEILIPCKALKIVVA